MHIFHKLEDFPKSEHPIILTIGNFDGVHLGHMHILKQMKNNSPLETKTCVMTFNNHPSTILKPMQQTRMIYTLPHKIQLLKESNIHYLLLLTFNIEFAQQSAEDFIHKVRSFIPFSHLFLGHDATLGKNRQGDKTQLQLLAKMLQFEVHYLEEFRRENNIVSSTLVRKFLQEGKLDKVKELLGRPYSIYSIIERGIGNGKQIGFPTVNLNVSSLCLPPFGVYRVSVKYKKEIFFGIANLGLAPTIKNIASPLLETHIFSFSEDLYDKEVEVIFHEFIRPEKKFMTVEDLRNQIQMDVAFVKAIPY